MVRLLVARAKFRICTATALAAVVMVVASSQPTAAQNRKDPAYTYNSTPTAIPGTASQKKSWAGKVGSAWSSGWKKTTGAFGKLVPKKKKPKPTSPKNDAVRLSSKTPQVNADLHASLAQLYMEKGQSDVALKQLEQAFRLEPKNLKATRIYARFLEKSGNMAEAETRFRRATTIDANSAGSWNDLGMCLARQGKRVDGVKALERAVQLRPNKPLYRNNLSAVLVELGDTQRALGHLAQAHGEANAHYNVGVLLVRKGDKQAAESHFKRALQIDGSLVAARQWLANINPQRQGELVAQRSFDTRRPAAPTRRPAAPTRRPAAPTRRPIATPAPRVPTATHRDPTAADNFWGSPGAPGATRNQPTPRPQVSPQRQPVVNNPYTQPRAQFAQPRTTAPTRVAPTQPRSGQSASDQFWGKPSAAPTQQTPPPRAQYAPPVRSQFTPPPRTTTPAPATVAPPVQTPASVMPSQQFRPYKVGSPPTPGRPPSYVKDPRLAPKPAGKYQSPLKFGQR